MYLIPDIHHRCVYSHRENKKYGDWSEEYTTSLNSQYAKLSEKNEYGAIPVNDIVSGDTVYLLWAVYSSGDSFGRASGAHVELIHVFKDLTLAQNAASQLKKIEKYDNKKQTIVGDNGNTIQYTAPWTGYFESLDYINVSPLIVQ